MMDLIEPAKNGDVTSLRRLHLAASGVDINFRCPPDGTTALYWAACNGHVAACDWLIRHSADVNLATEKSGSTPLHGAADRGHTDCVRILLKRGADVRHVTKSNGDTPLHLAAYRGHVDICRLLLEHGACADVLNKQGRTSMQEAQIKSHYDIFRLISKFRSDSSRDRQRSLRSLGSQRSSTCELDSIARIPPLPNDRMKMISEPIFSNNCSNNDHNVSSYLDYTSNVTDGPATSHGQLPLPPLSTGHQSRRISTASADRKSEMGSPEVAVHHRSSFHGGKVTRREDVIFGLIQRLSSLTSYILSLEVRLTVKDDLVAELTRENEALTRARRRYERAGQELEEERRLNAQLRDRMCAAERELERMRGRGSTPDVRQ